MSSLFTFRGRTGRVAWLASWLLVVVAPYISLFLAYDSFRKASDDVIVPGYVLLVLFMFVVPVVALLLVGVQSWVCLATTARRFRDCGRSPWLCLVLLFPAALFWFCWSFNIEQTLPGQLMIAAPVLWVMFKCLLLPQKSESKPRVETSENTECDGVEGPAAEVQVVTEAAPEIPIRQLISATISIALAAIRTRVADLTTEESPALASVRPIRPGARGFGGGFGGHVPAAAFGRRNLR